MEGHNNMKKSHRLIIQIDEATHDTLRTIAFERKQSIAKVVRGMIDRDPHFAELFDEDPSNGLPPELAAQIDKANGGDGHDDAI